MGNLWEWTDAYEGNRRRRVVSGGSWERGAEDQRPGARRWIHTGNRLDDYGFRVARTLD